MSVVYRYRSLGLSGTSKLMIEKTTASALLLSSLINNCKHLIFKITLVQYCCLYPPIKRQVL